LGPIIFTDKAFLQIRASHTHTIKGDRLQYGASSSALTIPKTTILPSVKKLTYTYEVYQQNSTVCLN